MTYAQRRIQDFGPGGVKIPKFRPLTQILYMKLAVPGHALPWLNLISLFKWNFIFFITVKVWIVKVVVLGDYFDALSSFNYGSISFTLSIPASLPYMPAYSLSLSLPLCLSLHLPQPLPFPFLPHPFLLPFAFFHSHILAISPTPCITLE